MYGNAYRCLFRKKTYPRLCIEAWIPLAPTGVGRIQTEPPPTPAACALKRSCQVAASRGQSQERPWMVEKRGVGQHPEGRVHTHQRLQGGRCKQLTHPHFLQTVYSNSSGHHAGAWHPFLFPAEWEWHPWKEGLDLLSKMDTPRSHRMKNDGAQSGALSIPSKDRSDLGTVRLQMGARAAGASETELFPEPAVAAGAGGWGAAPTSLGGCVVVLWGIPFPLVPAREGYAFHPGRLTSAVGTEPGTTWYLTVAFWRMVTLAPHPQGGSGLGPEDTPWPAVLGQPAWS